MAMMMDKLWSSHTTEQYSALKKEIRTHVTTETDPGDIMRSELSQSPKDKYYDSTNIRSLESGSSQGRGGEWQGLGAKGGDGESVFNRNRVSV